MNTTVRQNQAIDDLMERASQLLVQTEYFEAERVALKALERAWAHKDFERMSRICLPLQESRRQRRHLAIDTGRVFVVSSSLPKGTFEAGCYLLEPPLLGIDGHTFRDLANRRQVPTLILCREPLTRMGKWPIVGVGTGPTAPISIRTYVDPPSIMPPAPAWFLSTQEQLGDAAILKALAKPDASRFETAMPAAWRVDDLLHYMDAVPDHEKLMQALADECRKAATEPEAPPRRRGMDNPFSF